MKTIDFRTIIFKQGMKRCNRSVHDSKKNNKSAETSEKALMYDLHSHVIHTE